MNILYIWDGEYPWDIRVEKICNSLIAEGHSVFLVCRNQYAKARQEEYLGINVRRIASVSAKYKALNSFLTFPFFLSPVWLSEIFRVVKKEKIDLIVMRDLPMAVSAVITKKIFHVPIIFDMAECYPEMLRCTWKFEGLKFRNIFLRNPWIADIVEKFVVRNVDKTLVMVEESKLRLERKNVPSERIHIVSNTPVHDRFSSTEKNSREADDVTKLIYIGLLNPSRGLDTVIQGVDAYIKKHDKKIKLVIIGSGKAEKSLQNLSKKLGLLDYIEFTGWVDNKEIPTYLEQAHIGIVPHHICSHWENTIPNKIFDYMAASRAIIVSNVTPVVRVINEVGCGVVYEDFNADSFADKLKEINHPSKLDRMGELGRKAINEQYNWAQEEKELINVVNELAND